MWYFVDLDLKESKMDMYDNPINELIDEHNNEVLREKLITFSTSVHELTTRLIEDYPTIDMRELFKFTSKLLNRQAKHGPLIMTTEVLEFDKLKEDHDLWPISYTVTPVFISIHLTTTTDPFVSAKYSETLTVAFRVKKRDSKLS